MWQEVTLKCLRFKRVKWQCTSLSNPAHDLIDQGESATTQWVIETNLPTLLANPFSYNAPRCAL